MRLIDAVQLPEVLDGTRWLDVPVTFEGTPRYGLASRQLLIRDGEWWWACGPTSRAGFSLRELFEECRVVMPQPELLPAGWRS